MLNHANNHIIIVEVNNNSNKALNNVSIYYIILYINLRIGYFNNSFSILMTPLNMFEAQINYLITFI